MKIAKQMCFRLTANIRHFSEDAAAMEVYSARRPLLLHNTKCIPPLKNVA